MDRTQSTGMPKRIGLDKMSEKSLKMLFSMDVKEIKLAIMLAWSVLSIIVLLIIVSPFALSQNTIFMLSRLCELNHVPHVESPLYGMTRAFLFISRGNLAEALKLNRFSMLLYSIFVLNELLIITILFTKLITIKRR
jgi:hypothetical protein